MQRIFNDEKMQRLWEEYEDYVTNERIKFGDKAKILTFNEWRQPIKSW